VASGLPGIPLTKGFSSGPALICPHSRGRLTMMSANPGSSLHIDPNFLAEESDLDALSAGVEACTRLGLSRALVQWRAASVRVAPSDKTKLREVIKSNIVTYNHPVGTCAMGMGTRAVVDSSLCVHGISNLRVCRRIDNAEHYYWKSSRGDARHRGAGRRHDASGASLAQDCVTGVEVDRGLSRLLT
jgi:hypothetical protein